MSQDYRPTVDDIDAATIKLPDRDATLSAIDIEDLRRKFMELANEHAEAKEEISRLKRHDRTAGILDGLMEPYAKWTFRFMCMYCSVVTFILFIQGFSGFAMPLPEGVLQVIVGSTAVTVIGLVGMVLTGIFVGARQNFSGHWLRNMNINF